MEKVLTDRINSKVYLLIVGIGILSLIPIAFILNAGDYIEIGLAVILVLLTTGLLMFLKVELQFLPHALQYSFVPFIYNKQIKLEDIREVQIEEASFWRYGGIGIRWTGDGTAYVLGNEKNLVVWLKNNKKLVFSFKAKDEGEVRKWLRDNEVGLK